MMLLDPIALPRVLSLVQQRASSLRPRPADTRRRTPRSGWAARRGTRGGAGHGVRRASGTLPRRSTPPAGPARGSMDQPTRDPGTLAGVNEYLAIPPLAYARAFV